jgi:hypothetical protein
MVESIEFFHRIPLGSVVVSEIMLILLARIVALLSLVVQNIQVLQVAVGCFLLLHIVLLAPARQ